MTTADTPSAAWRAMSTQGAPSARMNFVSVWTGTRWFIWSGIAGMEGGRFVLPRDGALYDPKTDTWTAVSTQNAPSGRHSTKATWTGSHVLLWGGRGSFPEPDPQDGALYDPVADTWTPLTSADPPAFRSFHSADLVGDRWYWLCGCRGNQRRNDGAVFDVTQRQWSALRGADAPKPRWGHASVWTGQEFVLFGGFGEHNGYATENVAYNPTTDVWRQVATKGAPSRRTHHAAVWTGAEMFLWGGISTAGGKDMSKGGLYDPTTDSWRKVTDKNEPTPRAGHTLLWTGAEALVWGGGVRHSPAGTLAGPGGLFDPVKKSWRPLPSGEPAPRAEHGSVWTGTELLVWGGQVQHANYTQTQFDTGFRLAL